MTDRAMIQAFEKRYPLAIVAINSNINAPASKARAQDLLNGFSEGWQSSQAHARNELIEILQEWNNDGDEHSNQVFCDLIKHLSQPTKG